jgi:hypothetical protein
MKRTQIIAVTFTIAIIMLAWASAVHAGEIHDAAMFGDLDKLKTLLNFSPDLVNSTDASGNTPLHYAANKEIALELLANKASVSAREKTGGTPLHAAAYAGHIDVAAVLLAHGADVNAKSVIGLTPLHVTAFTENTDGKKNAVEMAKLLLANKANVRARDVDGNTPLDWAVAKVRPELADVLLSQIQTTLKKPDAGIPLKFKFIKGDTMKMEQRTLMELFTGLLDTDAGSMLTVQRVRNYVESTGPTNTLSCCTEAMRVESPPGKVAFDSDNKANREMDEHKALSAMIGVPVRMVMKPSGEVVSIDDTQLKDALSKTGKLDALDNIKSLEENLLEGSAIVLPEGPAQTNGTWKATLTHTMAGLGRLRSQYVYTFMGCETISGQRTAWIAITGTHTLDTDPDVKNPSVLGKCSVTGYALFSIDRGRLIGSKIGENLNLMTPVPGEAPKFSSVRTYTFSVEKR